VDDFRLLTLARNGKVEEVKSKCDKGHSRLLQLTLDALRNGKPAPIPFEELLEVTQATLAVHHSVAGQRDGGGHGETDCDAALALERS
jgi:hypothetical protein